MKTVGGVILIKKKIQCMACVLALGVTIVLSLKVCRLMAGIEQGQYEFWETMTWKPETDDPGGTGETIGDGSGSEEEEKDFIRWMEFTPTKEALQNAYEWDKETWPEQIHIDWISLLAYGAVKGGGEYDKKAIRAMDEYANAVRSGEKTMEELEELKYYDYYYEILSAVLSGMVGSYRIEVPNGDGTVSWQECYGLKAFSPIAKGFYYNDYDDFGAGRSYG